jgi:peptide/nickel transport system substrate-binding protein
VPKEGGLLVLGACAESAGLHAHWNFGGNCEALLPAIYESLVERDWSLASPNFRDRTPPPGPFGVLAESWELADDRITVTFHLRKGVKFHDGTDWNAEVAEINFRSLIDEDYELFNSIGSAHTGFTLSHVEEVRAVDEYTFEVTLLKPFYGFVDKLASYPCCPIISGKDMLSMTPEQINNDGAAGTGHYKVVEYEKGERQVVELYEDYWGENALLDEIVQVPVLDEASRVAALLAGEIDIALGIGPDNVILVDGFEGFSGYVRGNETFYGLEPNHREPPFDDQRVRRAVSLCFDRRELADDLLKGVPYPGAQIWPGAGEGRDPDGRQITDGYDPEEAKRLLAEAGYPDGFKTKFFSTPGAGLGIPGLEVNSYIVISLRECGIEVELINFEWLTYLSYWTGGIPENQDTGLFSISMGTADIAGYDQYLHSTGWPPSGWSVGWYANDDVDALIEKAWNATTYEDYLKYEREAHEIALVDYAYIPVIEGYIAYGVSDRVGGWTASSSWISRFNKAWVEYERE